MGSSDRAASVGTTGAIPRADVVAEARAIGAPRWLYVVLAACALLLTLAVVYYVVQRAAVGRYVALDGGGDARFGPYIIDTRDGVWCRFSSGLGSAPSIVACMDTRGNLERRQLPRPIELLPRPVARP